MTWAEIEKQLNEIMLAMWDWRKDDSIKLARKLRRKLEDHKWGDDDYIRELSYVSLCLTIVLDEIKEMNWELAYTVLVLARRFAWMKRMQEERQRSLERESVRES